VQGENAPGGGAGNCEEEPADSSKHV
jgi:hypothetical protein